MTPKHGGVITALTVPSDRAGPFYRGEPAIVKAIGTLLDLNDIVSFESHIVIQRSELCG